MWNDLYADSVLHNDYMISCRLNSLHLNCPHLHWLSTTSTEGKLGTSSLSCILCGSTLVYHNYNCISTYIASLLWCAVTSKHTYTHTERLPCQWLNYISAREQTIHMRLGMVYCCWVCFHMQNLSGMQVFLIEVKPKAIDLYHLYKTQTINSTGAHWPLTEPGEVAPQVSQVSNLWPCYYEAKAKYTWLIQMYLHTTYTHRYAFKYLGYL